MLKKIIHTRRDGWIGQLISYQWLFTSIYRWVRVQIQDYNGFLRGSHHWIQSEKSWSKRLHNWLRSMTVIPGSIQSYHLNKGCLSDDTGSSIGCVPLSMSDAWVIIWSLSRQVGQYKKGWIFIFGVSVNSTTSPVNTSSTKFQLPVAAAPVPALLCHQKDRREEDQLGHLAQVTVNLMKEK